MSRLGVVGYGEGEVGSSRGGAEFPDGFVGVGVEAAAFLDGESRVFDPEFEAAVGAD